MSKQSWRENFIAALARYDVRPDVARRVMRYAATLHRLAEAQCNGDWPYDNGEWPVKPCSRCEAGTVISALRATLGTWPDGAVGTRYVCPDCRTSDLARAYVAAELSGWQVSFQGDPRGYVVNLTAPDGREVGVP